MKFIIVLSICIAAASPVSAAVDKNAVVSILSTTKAGQAALGTGFFISADGRVLTCYHVIREASHLEVLASGVAYSNVEVESLDAAHDLAVIAVRGLRARVPFLRLSQDTPASFATASLETFGHPSVLRSQRLVVKPTSDTFSPSQDFRDLATGARLFNLRNVDLISIDLTIFNGLSGAPLVFNDAVVGIISGSFREGGSIAWAIPTKYVTALNPIRKTAAEIAAWPPLTLMANPFTSLRKQAYIGLGLVVALEKFAETVDSIEMLVQSTLTEEYIQFLKDVHAFVRQQVARRGADTTTDDAYSEQMARELIAKGYSRKRLAVLRERLLTFGDNLIQRSVKLEANREQLAEQLGKYFEQLGHSKEIDNLRETVRGRLKTIDATIESWSAGIPDVNDDSKITIGDFDRLFVALLNNDALRVGIEASRSIHDVVETVFEAAAASRR